MYRFEKLRVYHDSLDLVKLIYEFTARLPNDEKFALTDQLKRSCTSIVLNIAEGTGSHGDIEFKKFLRSSLKSLYESVAGLKISQKLFNSPIEKELIQCELVGKELSALIKSLTNDKIPKQKFLAKD